MKTRKETALGDCWNVEALYPTFEEWEKDFETAKRANQHPIWPEIMGFQGRLSESSQILNEVLENIFSISRQLEKLYTYAHLKHDEDIAEERYKSAFAKISALFHEFGKETSWFESELLAVEAATLKSFLESPELQKYRFYVEKIIRMRPFTLSSSEEKLIALAGQSLMSSCKAFNSINDADFHFGTAKDSQGEEKPISHASYGMFIRDPDRTLRKNVFQRFHKQYADFENTLTELLNGQIQAHIFSMRARNYPSCVEAALYPKNIDPSVYHALIKATEDNITPLHRYIELRKKILGVEELNYYDLQVPLIADFDIKMPYQEAEDIIIESVAPLGNDYQNLLRKGLKEDRWVDRYENKSKRSGAYSSGCFDSMPYILMNYKDLLRDVFTLAHEAGHSMHSLLSRTTQPYWYADYPIFVAEVASTFNEDLLMRLMMERAQSKEEKIFLINQKIDDIRGTLFRQTLFAEFEFAIHDLAEKHTPLTPQLLRTLYRKLNQKYFGEHLTLDEYSDIEWARVPHFYYNFYVYQYATGISAALALTDRVIGGGKSEREDYLNFLKGGSSRYPIDLLQTAGVDMRTPTPVNKAIEKFGSLVNELEKLLGETPQENKPEQKTPAR